MQNTGFAKTLLAASLVLAGLSSPSTAGPLSAHSPLILEFGPIPNPNPHPIKDAGDAKETATQIWLSKVAASIDRENWHVAFSVTHDGTQWVLKEPGFTITLDEADGHIVSAVVGE